MYAIVCWTKKGEGPFPVVNNNGVIWNTVDLKVADEHAASYEKFHPDLDCRVVSLEGVVE